MNAGGARWKMSDLSSFRSEWVKPISTNYKGYDVYQMPPQTQGFATLEMLNIIEQCGARWATTCTRSGRARPSSGASWSRPSGSPTRICEYNGDPRFVEVPLDRLISKRYAASLCGQISLGHAPPVPAAARRTACRYGRRARRHRLPDDG